MFSLNEIAEIKLKFETQGFVHLRSVMPTDMLMRVKSAFDAAATRAIDQQKKSANTTPGSQTRFFDIPNILDQDPVFVDLVDLPTIFPLLVDIVGSDIQLNHTTARLFYPGPTFTSPWHSDISHVIGLNQANTLNFLVKAHFFIEDLSPDQGCLAFIPGSHRYPAGHPKPNVHDIDSSMAVIKTVPRAGDVVIFNTHLLHMATDNRSEVVRKSIIYAYSHYWVKHYDSAVPADLERFADSVQRKQLFGVDIEGIPYFNRRLDKNEHIALHTTLFSASKQFLKRALLKRA
ncbi:MAG: phytanoyl-CoA dioxygenase family protein [Burkholderiaceae bacterium]